MKRSHKWASTILSNLWCLGGREACNSPLPEFKHAEASLPSHALLAITYNCVAACPHCYLLQQDSSVFDSRRMMDEGMFKSIINSPSFQAVNKVTFAGGEALLHPELFHWIHEVEKRGIKDIATITNGLLLQQDKVVEQLLNTPSISQFNVSLDADSKEQYCKVKGVKNANFDKILQSVQTLTSHFRGSSTRVSGSFVIYNMVAEDIKRILLFGQSLGFHKITIHALHMISGNDTSADSEISIFKKVSEAIMSHTDYDIDITVKIPVSVADRTFYCPSLANYMCIGADALMAPCCHVPWGVNYGAFDPKLTNAINHSTIMAMREKFLQAQKLSNEKLLAEPCQHCPKRTRGSLCFNAQHKKWTRG